MSKVQTWVGRQVEDSRSLIRCERVENWRFTRFKVRDIVCSRDFLALESEDLREMIT